MCKRVIAVRWVNPETEIPKLVNKAVDEVFHKNFEPALETLRTANELHPNGFIGGFILLCRALVHHSLGQKEGAKRDLQESERLFSISMLAEGPGEHLASSVPYGIISDMVGVPTYTKEKLLGKQMIVKWSVAVTKNQRLDVELRLTPSIIMQRYQRTFIHLLQNNLFSFSVNLCRAG